MNKYESIRADMTKDIKNGDNLIEVETDRESYCATIDELIEMINEIEIPIYTDTFFVKKAEIELNKVLKR